VNLDLSDKERTGVGSTAEDIRAHQGPGHSAEENFRMINLVTLTLH
jgi:hypothetical protein